jgi:hypothetical protein
MTLACRALTAQGAQLAIGAPGSPCQRRGADLSSGVVTRQAGSGHGGEMSRWRGIYGRNAGHLLSLPRLSEPVPAPSSVGTTGRTLGNQGQ